MVPLTTIANAVEAAARWAEEKICPGFLLKQDDADRPYCSGDPPLAHPRVYRMFAPVDRSALPDGVPGLHPSITVSAAATELPLLCETRVELSFRIAVWNPGSHGGDSAPAGPAGLRRSSEGWADCYAVADAMVAELRRCRVMGGLLEVDLSQGVKVAPYKEDGSVVDLWPYYYCTVEVSARAGSPPPADLGEFL